jgi:hypothetical protein
MKICTGARFVGEVVFASMAGRKAGVFCAKRCFMQRTMVMTILKDRNKLSVLLSNTKST